MQLTLPLPQVASVAVHENYDPYVLDSDLAVIKLLDKAKIGEKILPICLPDQRQKKAEREQVEEDEEGKEEELPATQGLVIGWSPLPDLNLGPDERARVGRVHLANVVPCEQQYARNGVPVSVTDNMLCASQKPNYGESNICPSDTGGLLVLPALPGRPEGDSQMYPFSPTGSEGGSLWRLAGLVSFGYDQGECHPDLYTVYTHVAHFKNWIESNMK